MFLAAKGGGREVSESESRSFGDGNLRRELDAADDFAGERMEDAVLEALETSVLLESKS